MMDILGWLGGIMMVIGCIWMVKEECLNAEGVP